MATIDLNGPVLADTVYDSGKLVAKDVAATMPNVNHMTADFKAMGTITMPIIGQIEAMELSVTKIGLDMGMRSMSALESRTLEFRWAQDVKKPDGSTKVVGCKAFLRCVPKGIPGLTVDPGNQIEGEMTYSVTRYQLFVDGTEYWLIDQLNQILRIGGVDYYGAIRNLL